MVKKQKSIPTGVKIISVLHYIGAGVMGIIGLMFILGGGMFESLLAENPELASLSAGLFVFFGILFICFGVLAFFIGRGLWKLQNWARITAIVFSCIGAISSIISLVMGDFGSIVSLAIQVIIGSYLWFNKDVKKAFA